MPTGNEYRAKAAHISAQAEGETDPHLVLEFETLARSYLRLAEMADRAKPDIAYETPERTGPDSDES